MADILTGTPESLTYGHELVKQAWMVVWAITSGALVVILGWMGLSFIMAEHLGSRQAGWREMVPRLVLGLVAAASSLWWCALVLDIADAVSGFVAVSLNVTAGDMLRSTLRTLMTAVDAGSVGMALLLAVLYLVYGFFVLYVIVQMVLRLALIDILLALAPIALGLWILPHTAGWGRHWLRLFMTTTFQQAIQLIAWPWDSASSRRWRISPPSSRCRTSSGSCSCPWPSSTWRPGCPQCWATRAPSIPGSRCSISA